jgi:hypothetical protein
MPEQAREKIFGAGLSAVRAAANSAASRTRSNVAPLKPWADQTDFDVIIVGAGLSGIGVAGPPRADHAAGEGRRDHRPRGRAARSACRDRPPRQDDGADRAPCTRVVLEDSGTAGAATESSTVGRSRGHL